MAGEFFRSERRPGRGHGGGKVRRRVHGQVDQDPVVSGVDDQSAERVAVMDPLSSPASLAGDGLQGIAGGGNMAALGGGEEVEVLGGPRRKVLGEQGRSPGQQEALAGGSAKNSLATSSWNADSSGWLPSAVVTPPRRMAGPVAPTRT